MRTTFVRRLFRYPPSGTGDGDESRCLWPELNSGRGETYGSLLTSLLGWLRRKCRALMGVERRRLLSPRACLGSLIYSSLLSFKTCPVKKAIYEAIFEGLVASLPRLHARILLA